MRNPCLIFWGTPKAIPQWQNHFIVPSAVCEDSDVSTFMTILALFLFFCNFNSHPSRCKVISWVFICISLMPNDMEYFFLCLFTMCLPSSEKYLFCSHTHFLIELFVFVHVCLLHCKSPFHILDTKFINMWFANTFPHSRVCIFPLWIMSFFFLFCHAVRPVGS